MEEITIKLGGKDYTVQPLKIKASKAWRQSLESKFDGVIGAIQSLGTTQATNWAGVGAVIDQIKGSLIGSIDTVLELVCEYSEAINQDRDRIEEEAYDDEVITAFTQILGLAFPLGRVVNPLIGLMVDTTSKN